MPHILEKRRLRLVRRIVPVLPVVLAVAVLSGCLGGGGGGGGDANPMAARIRYTASGVPHVKAATFKGAGYGYGYAFAKENLCLYAEELVTLRGERAQFFGLAGGYLGQMGTVFGNVDSDFFYRLMLTADQVAKTKAAASPQIQDLLAGFAAGYNRLLRDTPAAQVPAACRGAAWLRPMTESDAYLRVMQAALTASSLGFISQIGSAQPPGANAARSAPAAAGVAGVAAKASAVVDYEQAPIAQALVKIRDHSIGSNGYGLGLDATDNGRGLLLANPHFPWWGVLRMNQLHLTVESENYDVSGATLLGIPIPLIGFNSKLAWTHTLSTDNRFTLRLLALDPASPTRYVKDGKSVAMTAVPLTINGLAPNGSIVPITRTLYTTVVAVPHATEVLILQHPLEVANAKNTARLLHLCLPNSRLVTGEAFTDAESLRAPWGDAGDASAPRQLVLLYPETPLDTASDLAPPPPLSAAALQDPSTLRLVVLDATWRKSRKMLYASPPLQGLPRLGLTDVPTSRYSIRKAHLPGQLSTFEATCAALMRLEGESENVGQGGARFQPLLDAFDGFVAQQAAFMPR